MRPYGDKYASSLTVETVFTKLLSLMKEGFATSAHAGIVQKYAHNAYLDWTPCVSFSLIVIAILIKAYTDPTSLIHLSLASTRTRLHLHSLSGQKVLNIYLWR